MKISFYGASEVVTGSCYLLELFGYCLLIDCGMFQGSKVVRELNYGDFPFDPMKIDALVLSHAHIDHSGLIPKLIKAGYTGPVYATRETAELCSILFPDSGHIQEMEIERKNRKLTRAGLPLLEPIYTANDGYAAVKQFVQVKYGQKIVLTPELSFELMDAGHILGSAHIIVNIQEEEAKKIVFSGDIGTENQPFVEDPVAVKEADIIVMESTYGDRNHADKSKRLEILAGVINSAQAKGGNIIIPAFAIERTQDFISYLNILQTQGKIPVLPIYIDSPLAVAATEIFRNNPENFDQESRDLIKSGRNPLKMDNLHFSITAEESRELNNIYGGAIIISASGMADAGRIRHHLKHNLWRKDATVIFVGFQAEGTLGRKLIDGEKQVTIHGETIAVEADVVQLPSFSSHADRDELFKWVEAAGRKAEQIILVHGEGSSIEDFAILLEQELGKKPFIPDLGDCLEFKNNTIVVSKAEKPWLQAMEEKLNRRISRTGETVRKAGNTRKGRGINLARINHAYADIRTNLKLFYERGRAERDYGLLLHTFAEISRILKESENPAEPQIPERFRKKNRR